MAKNAWILNLLFKNESLLFSKHAMKTELSSHRNTIKSIMRTTVKILCSWILQSLCVISITLLLNLQDCIPGVAGNSIVFTTLLYTTFFYWTDKICEKRHWVIRAFIPYILTISICLILQICDINKIVIYDDGRGSSKWIPLPMLPYVSAIFSLYSLAFIKVQKILISKFKQSHPQSYKKIKSAIKFLLLGLGGITVLAILFIIVSIIL